MAGKHGDRNWAISDRSGMRFRMSEMIREPGTGYLVHKSESDGRYNAVDHPQAHINEYATFGDPFPIENTRPDIAWAATSSTLLTDESGNTLFAGYTNFNVADTSLLPDYYPWPGSNR